jgi:hypothetical protein
MKDTENTTKRRHKHADMINAWANGEKIQYYCEYYDTWLDNDDPTWDKDTEYRIKPLEKLTDKRIDAIRELYPQAVALVMDEDGEAWVCRGLIRMREHCWDGVGGRRIEILDNYAQDWKKSLILL